MTEFKREDRYFVLKIKHIVQALGTAEIEELYNLGWRIKKRTGEEIECVVVEHDWPEYEIVWKMIEDRCNCVQNGTAELYSRIVELEAEIKDREDTESSMTKLSVEDGETIKRLKTVLKDVLDFWEDGYSALECPSAYNAALEELNK